MIASILARTIQTQKYNPEIVNVTHLNRHNPI